MPPRIAAAAPEDLPAIRALFAAYAASLPVDPGCQGFAAGLAALPGAWARRCCWRGVSDRVAGRGSGVML